MEIILRNKVNVLGYRILPFIFLFLIFGCSQNHHLEKYKEARTLMGTIVQMDVCRDAGNAERTKVAYTKVWERLEEISWKMNVFDEKSDVAKVNNAFPESVAIDADTYQVLEKAVNFSRQTQGAFDITVWPLIQLWKKSERINQFPEYFRIEEILQAIGPDNIELLPDNKVRLRNKLTKLDLGGIAKGYAVDEAVRIFREEKIEDLFIDAGGDIYVGGHNCEGKPWRIGIRDPRDQSKIIDVLALSNVSITTSGNYEQYYKIQGEKWSHIINPVTGYPQKGVISATVIAPTAQEADALSTALSVLGEKQGTDFINERGAQYASFIITEQRENQIEKFMSKEYKVFQVIKK